MIFAESDPEMLDWIASLKVSYQGEDTALSFEVSGPEHHEVCKVSSDGQGKGGLHIKYEPETLYHYVNVNIELTSG
jgi:hypothetical protein